MVDGSCGRQFGGVVYQQHFPRRRKHLVTDAGGGCYQIQIEFSFQTLLNNFHVQKSQKTATEAEAQRHGSVRFVHKGSVVEFEFFQSVLQIVVFTAVCGENTAKHHGFNLFVAFQRLQTGFFRIRHRVPHFGVADGFYACANVTDVPCRKARHAFHGRGKNPHFRYVEHLAGRFKHFYFASHRHTAVHNAHKNYHAFVVVVLTVENERLQRGVFLPLRFGNFVHDGVQHVHYVYSLLGGNERGVGCIKPYCVFNFPLTFLHVCRGKIYLVDDGNYFQIVFQSEVAICQRLRFHALRCVHNKQRPFAGGKRT